MRTQIYIVCHKYKNLFHSTYKKNHFIPTAPTLNTDVAWTKRRRPVQKAPDVRPSSRAEIPSGDVVRTASRRPTEKTTPDVAKSRRYRVNTVITDVAPMDKPPLTDPTD